MVSYLVCCCCSFSFSVFASGFWLPFHRTMSWDRDIFRKFSVSDYSLHIFRRILNQCTYKSGGSMYTLLGPKLAFKLFQPKMSLSFLYMQLTVTSGKNSPGGILRQNCSRDNKRQSQIECFLSCIHSHTAIKLFTKVVTGCYRGSNFN